MGKFLLVINGETFRHGGQGSRERGDEESFNLQMIATESQLKFINYVKENNNFDCDIFMNIYSLNDEWDKEFIKQYGDLVKLININNTLLGETSLHSQTLNIIKNKINYNEYEFILFLRPDLFLKNYFSTIFNCDSDKITFAHVNEIEDPLGKSWNQTQRGNPAVNHQIFFVPKKFFTELLDHKLWFNHYSYDLILQHNIKSTNIDFFIYTYHSSSTDVTWNPIFHQVGRNETTFWIDKKYRVNKITHKIDIVEDESIYCELINNDFKDVLGYDNR